MLSLGISSIFGESAEPSVVQSSNMDAHERSPGAWCAERHHERGRRRPPVLLAFRLRAGRRYT